MAMRAVARLCTRLAHVWVLATAPAGLALKCLGDPQRLSLGTGGRESERAIERGPTHLYTVTQKAYPQLQRCQGPHQRCAAQLLKQAQRWHAQQLELAMKVRATK